MEHSLAVIFVEPQDVGPAQPVVGRAVQHRARLIVERLLAVPDCRQIVGNQLGVPIMTAAPLAQVAVNGEDALASCSLMKTVDVLSDQPKTLTDTSLETNERIVGRVRIRGHAYRPSIQVPAPNLLGHFAECLSGGHLLWVVVTRPDGPIPFFAAKGRNAAFGADARPGHNRDSGPAFASIVEQLGETFFHRLECTPKWVRPAQAITGSRLETGRKISARASAAQIDGVRQSSAIASSTGHPAKVASWETASSSTSRKRPWSKGAPGASATFSSRSRRPSLSRVMTR